MPNQPPVTAANGMQAWRQWGEARVSPPKKRGVGSIGTSNGILGPNESNVSNRRASNELDGVAGELLTPLSDTDTSSGRSPSSHERERTLMLHDDAVHGKGVVRMEIRSSRAQDR